MTTKRSKFAVLSMLLVMAALAGCGTIDGIGRDISGASNRVSNML